MYDSLELFFHPSFFSDDIAWLHRILKKRSAGEIRITSSCGVIVRRGPAGYTQKVEPGGSP